MDEGLKIYTLVAYFSLFYKSILEKREREKKRERVFNPLRYAALLQFIVTHLPCKG
jgi:hypothetical protein|eukprot:COSAG01_NODE_8355_length_2818_cov_17.918067_4_plen_56_part_00